ncbi:MAG: CBS domain-containing protein, partial [Actinomycetota bacterium]
GESIADVAARLQFHEIGALAVYEDQMMVGIITERDLVRAMADGVDPMNTPVAKYMTEDAVAVSPNTDLQVAAATMIAIGSRHLPVSEGAKVVGMISARDLLDALAYPRD